MASVEYDPSSTALYVRIKKGKVASSRPLADNLILDLNRRNEILGIEIIGPRPEDLKTFNQRRKSQPKRLDANHAVLMHFGDIFRVFPTAGAVSSGLTFV